ncbi:hypothetical protein JCM17960_30200 [Magnetospira thiophila]
MADIPSARDNDTAMLKKQLLELHDYMQQVRREIAAIHRPPDPDHHFSVVGDQLDAIVVATEEATHEIMECMESNARIIEELRPSMADAAQRERLSALAANGTRVFEACTFQDITGQRITKVVTSLKYLETRINAIVDVGGRQQVETTPVAAVTQEADRARLAGPALPDQGISQEEIDKLFE